MAFKPLYLSAIAVGCLCMTGAASAGPEETGGENSASENMSRFEARQLAQAQRLLEDKLPEAPVRCAPRTNLGLLRSGDDSMLLRFSPKTAYQLKFRNACARKFDRGNIIVSRNSLNGRYCEGDVLDFVDRFTGAFTGFCVIDSVTPFKSGKES